MHFHTLIVLCTLPLLASTSPLPSQLEIRGVLDSLKSLGQSIQDAAQQAAQQAKDAAQQASQQAKDAAQQAEYAAQQEAQQAKDELNKVCFGKSIKANQRNSFLVMEWLILRK